MNKQEIFLVLQGNHESKCYFSYNFEFYWVDGGKWNP